MLSRATSGLLARRLTRALSVSPAASPAATPSGYLPIVDSLSKLTPHVPALTLMLAVVSAAVVVATHVGQTATEHATGIARVEVAAAQAAAAHAEGLARAGVALAQAEKAQAQSLAEGLARAGVALAQNTARVEVALAHAESDFAARILDLISHGDYKRARSMLKSKTAALERADESMAADRAPAAAPVADAAISAEGAQ